MNDKSLSARWQDLFWALPPGEMRSKLRSLECDSGTALRELAQVKAENERLKAIIDDMTSVSAAGGWQPIGTAPKDSTYVLGHIPIYYYGPQGNAVIAWIDHCWRDASASRVDPSHWMPLPEAPST